MICVLTRQKYLSIYIDRSIDRYIDKQTDNRHTDRKKDRQKDCCEKQKTAVASAEISSLRTLTQ